MHIHLISGFLGSGKTTAILKAVRYLQAHGKKVAVINNDQGGKLVDAALFSMEGIPGEQVLEGCFCCRYDDLEISIENLHNNFQPDIILAEAVGSCTDMIATVIKPLMTTGKGLVQSISFSSFADWRLLEAMLQEGGTSFAEDIRYIFFKQLEEATSIVVNKTDLGDASRLETLKAVLQTRYQNKQLYYQNSSAGNSMSQWLTKLEAPLQAVPGLDSLEINYDIYGAGEARLAYLDQELEILSDNENAVAIGVTLIDRLAKCFLEKDWNIGHLKTWSEQQGKYSYTFGGKDNLDPNVLPAVKKQLLLVNARVETSPEELENIFWETVRQTEADFGCLILNAYSKLYKPGYPVPQHRIA